MLLFGTPVAIALAKAVTVYLHRTLGDSISISRDREVVAKILDSRDAARIAEALAKAKRAASSPLPQCANSAEEFEGYVRNVLGVAEAILLNLFDSELSASDQIEKVEDWLTAGVSRNEDRRRIC